MNEATRWNHESLLANVDGCEEDLKRLLEVWLRQSPKLLAEMQNGINRDDAKIVQHAAHTLKGSIQILGADEICSAVYDVETAAKQADLIAGRQAFTRLESQMALMTEHVITLKDTI